MSSVYLTLEEAGASLPRPKSQATLEFWARRGLVNGAVKLETVKIGGTVCVARTSLADFVDRLTAAQAAKKKIVERSE